MLHLDHAYQKPITHRQCRRSVILMYNLLEYSGNFSMTSGSLWNYYRDEVNDSANENKDANNYRVNNNKATSKSYA